MKSHLAAARCLVAGCGNTCAALFRAVDAALEGEIALKGKAARAREAACVREAARAREAAQAGENVRVGDEGEGTASDGGGGTCKARMRGRACLP